METIKRRESLAVALTPGLAPAKDVRFYLRAFSCVHVPLQG